MKRRQQRRGAPRLVAAALVLCSLALAKEAAAALDGIEPPQPMLSGKTGTNGWWRGNVTVQWRVDTSSGFVGSSGCGPDVVIGDIKGATRTCSATYRDPSGQTYAVATRTAPINIDATRPHVARPEPKRPPDRYGWYSHDIRMFFSGSDTLSGIASCSAPAYRGPTSAEATVTGRCRDAAGNRAARTFTFKYAEPFLTPRKGARLVDPPLLDWPDVARARFYNVQLWHDGKVLTRWPEKSRLRLRHSWRFHGERIRLKPGRYEWYVWPRIHKRYRAAVGHSVFYKRAG